MRRVIGLNRGEVALEREEGGAVDIFVGDAVKGLAL